MTKDELFSLEDSLAQAVFISMMNSRYVSVKQGTYALMFISYFRLEEGFVRAPNCSLEDIYGLLCLLEQIPDASFFF